MPGEMEVYYQSRTSEVFGATISLIVLATIAVAARIVARRISVADFWWDDGIIVLALSLDWGLSISYWIQVSQSGSGRHTVEYGGPVDQGHVLKFFKIFLAIQLLYFASAAAIKTSLLLLYFRIFGVIRWFRILLAAVWAIVVLYFVVNTFVAVFKCSPVEFLWDKSIKGGTCINENQFYRWNGFANLLIDFVIWSLTLPVIWRLNLNARQKLSLSAIFLLGLLACVASIVRVVTFNQVIINDITYTLVPASIWTVIEQSVGIICACLPSTRPLFGRLLSNIKHSSGRGTDENIAARSDTIALSHYGLRPTSGTSADTTRTGFSRLDEENAIGVNTVTAYAAKTPRDDLPTMPDAILKEQSLEQHIDNGI